jgi:C-terminal processing protease CtpA/Prc
MVTRTPGKGLGLGLEDSHMHKVTHVTPGSPAALAGCKVGDKIIGVGGQLVQGSKHAALIEALQNSGSSFNMQIQTPGDSGSAASTPARPAATTKSPARTPRSKGQAVKTYKSYTVTLKGPRLGVDLKSTSNGNQQVAVIAKGGSAERSKLEAGDVVHTINGKKITGKDHAAVVVLIKAGLVSTNAVTLGYYR